VFYGISYISSVIGIILTTIAKQNVKLDVGTICFETAMVVSAFLFQSIYNEIAPQTISIFCGNYIELTEENRAIMDKIYGLNLPDVNVSIFNFQLLMSFIVIMHSINILSQLRRTITIGPSIIMMMSLRFDLMKFFTAFTLPLIAFVIITLFNSSEFTANNLEPFDILLQLFSAFTGEQQFGEFNKYFGQSYLVIFILVYFILLLNLMIAMFSNTY